MNTKKVAIAIVTCFLLLTIKNSKADSIYVYGLANRQTGMIDETVTKSLKKYILDTIGQKHTVIFDENRFENPLKKENVLLNTGGHKDINWIIFFGHGSSRYGHISDVYGNNFYPLTNLMYNSNWNSIKGVLIFGCAVLDIGDFGCYKTKVGDNASCENLSQFLGYEKEYCGNYCGTYYKYNEKEKYKEKGLCIDDPDPGLKWEELARRKNIQYILGFNSYAPLLESGGAAMTKKFFSNWIELENKQTKQENFLEAWKKSLMYSKDETPSANIIERSYLKRDKAGSYLYGIGRANPESKAGELNWATSLKPAWSEKTISLPISIDDFYISRYSECNFFDVRRNKDYILYFSLMNLCTRGIISNLRGVFLPTVDATLADVSKMIVNAAGLKRIPITKDFDCKTDDKGNFKFGCDYIDDLVENEIIEGEPLINFDPDDTVSRADFIKMLINAFFKEAPEKEYDCPPAVTVDIGYFSGEREKEWYCQFFLAADKCGLLNDNILKIEGKIDPDTNIKRGDAAILIDRARILKETEEKPGEIKCLSR